MIIKLEPHQKFLFYDEEAGTHLVVDEIEIDEQKLVANGFATFSGYEVEMMDGEVEKGKERCSLVIELEQNHGGMWEQDKE